MKFVSSVKFNIYIYCNMQTRSQKFTAAEEGGIRLQYAIFSHQLF